MMTVRGGAAASAVVSYATGQGFESPPRFHIIRTLCLLTCTLVFQDFYPITPDLGPGAMPGWRHDIKVTVCEPKAVIATAAYRKSQEPLTDFVADCCVLGPRYRVPATRLRVEYEAWCKSEGLKHPLAGKAWGAALRALGCTDFRAGGGARWWNGIDVRVGDARTPDERQPGEDNPPPFGDRP